MNAAAALDRLAPETRGALGVICAGFLFVCMDAVAKSLAEQMPPLMVVWARYTSQTLLLLAIFARSLPVLIRSTAPGVQLARGVLLFAVTMLYFSALKHLQLAEATALMQTQPLLITVLAAVVLSEKVGPRRWAGVAVGLIGAFIIIRPGLGVFHPAALLALGSSLAMAGYQIATRMLGGADRIWTTMLYTTGFGALAASVALPFVWVTPPLHLMPAMAAVGLIGFAGHFCLVWALGQAPASVLAPFNYLGVVWSISLGLVIFGQLPDGWTIFGAALVVGAGLYVWHRERVRHHAPPAP